VYTSALLAAVPNTLGWSPTVGLVMILCNVLAIAFGRATIQIKDAEPASGAILGLGLPALLGATSFGHILGAGAILGLSNLGVL
jgi:photosystem I subunit X